MQIHFLSDVLVAVASPDLKVLNRELKVARLDFFEGIPPKFEH